MMNLFLIPMWLLSGAVFPPDKAASWVGYVMKGNPLTYGVDALRRVLTGREGIPFGISLGVTAVFAVVMFLLAAAMARRR
jgi:ABC-2 type transport system permease protein